MAHSYGDSYIGIRSLLFLFYYIIYSLLQLPSPRRSLTQTYGGSCMGGMSMGHIFEGMQGTEKHFHEINGRGIQDMYHLSPYFLAEIAETAAGTEGNRDLAIFIAGMLAARASETPVPAPMRPRRRANATEHPSHWYTYGAYEQSLKRAIAAAVSVEPVENDKVTT